MRYRLISILISILIILTVTACGSIEGEYVQIPAPFESDISTSVDSSGSSSNSETVSSETSSSGTNITVQCKDDELVRVTDYIPDAKIDIKYATTDNFTGGKIYDFDDAYLRYGTVMKLKKAADALRKQGYLILIWDGYRPQKAQFTLFENTPDPTYVSDPNKGFSSHSSGGTVDITLVKLDGTAVEMPSGFDEFSAKADRSYSDVSKTAAENSKLLEKAMQDAGFKGYSKEWWHYSDTESYNYDDIKEVKLLSKSKKTYLADCDEYISLRSEASSSAEAIEKIPANSVMTPVCWVGKFVGVLYGDKFGYVSSSFVK